MVRASLAKLASLLAAYADQFLRKKYLNQHKHSPPKCIQSFTQITLYKDIAYLLLRPVTVPSASISFFFPSASRTGALQR